MSGGILDEMAWMQQPGMLNSPVSDEFADIVRQHTMAMQAKQPNLVDFINSYRMSDNVEDRRTDNQWPRMAKTAQLPPELMKALIGSTGGLGPGPVNYAGFSKTGGRW